MNDSGAMLALQALTNVGKADWNRVLLLRTARNFDRPRLTLRPQRTSRERRMARTPLTASFVQPGCTNARVMRTNTPSLAINGSKEIGLFISAISSLYIRPQYTKPLALVKNLLTSITVIPPLWRLRLGD